MVCRSMVADADDVEKCFTPEQLREWVRERKVEGEPLAHYGEDRDEFLGCKPGITGWWQVEARNDATYADGSRQELELYYARHASATLDWNIVLRTVGAVFGGTGK